MSYLSISKCAGDMDFMDRVTACASQEGASDPYTAMQSLRWPVASASDIEAAYESALAADNPAPGADPTVITDGMILSAVQANLPTP